jgi:hypothetical protein
VTPPDRLALAVRVMKARRTSVCPSCRAPIMTGQQIARLTSPGGWIHLTCVPVVAALQATMRSRDGAAP